MNKTRRAFTAGLIGLALGIGIPRRAAAILPGVIGRLMLRGAVRAVFRSVARRAIGGVARRSIVRGGFRRLASGGGQRLIRAEVSAAMRKAQARRVSASVGRQRMRKRLGGRTYKIRDRAGRVIGQAAVEDDLLVFRQGSRRLGFAQWEGEDLVLYRSSGRRLVRLKETRGRVMVHDEDNNYLGQFIEEQIQDAVVNYFIDAMGERHQTFVLPEARPGTEIPEDERTYSYDPSGSAIGYSTIRDGILLVFDTDGVELMRGALEEDVLVFYDDEGEKRGEFRQIGDRIVATDEVGAQVGYIVVENDRAVYYDESERRSSWVHLSANDR